jgi:hypothetical protein
MCSSSCASCSTASNEFVDLGDRAQLARQRLAHLDMAAALQHQQVAHRDGLARIADVQRHAALQAPWCTRSTPSLPR